MVQKYLGEQDLQRKGDTSGTEGGDATSSKSLGIWMVSWICVHPGLARGDDDRKEEKAVENEEEDRDGQLKFLRILSSAPAPV